MVPKSAATSQIGAVSASTVPTTRSKTVYAADTGPAHALSAEAQRRVHPNHGFLTVGSEEQLPHGTLSCRAEGGRVVVELRRSGKLVGRRLELCPDDSRLLRAGARVPEAAFSVEVPEFIGTPWHELDYVSVWTVWGLRKNGEMELSIER